MKLLEQVRQVLRVRRFALRTEQCYLRWIEQFIRFHKGPNGFRHPADMGAAEVEQFLTHLAVQRRVAASTQNQALGALLFLYRDVLRLDLGSLDAVRETPVSRTAARPRSRNAPQASIGPQFTLRFCADSV